MIKSAASKRSLKSQSITSKLDQFDPNNKRNFDDNQLSSFDNCMEKVLKRIKLNEDENNDLYVTKRN
ncbi:hypothetical protein RhiirA1_423896 [Rhizophagus irregularis]|nr:hypothetical protein RhiirA1_423896 [Rhizophagus irregularis]CAB5351233.1 unnamed protein product [Rhizophagus irregularis]